MRVLIILFIFVSTLLSAQDLTNKHVYLENIIDEFSMAPVQEQCDDEFMTMSNEFNKVIMKKFSRKVYVNNTLYWLNDAFSFSKSNGWFFVEHDYEKLLMPLFVANVSTNFDNNFTVFIDPGHGGNDPGAFHPSFSELREADIVFNIATNLAGLLKDAGVNVVLSRTNNVYVGLSDRTAKANDVDAQLFLSIHVNSAFGTAAKGFETFTLPLENCHSTSGNSKPRPYLGNNYDIFNSLLGYNIQKTLLDCFPEQMDRGVKHARYEVLKNINCPAALVECGFISNSAERKLLSKKSHQQLVAKSLFNGVTAYINSADKVDEYIAQNNIETLVFVEPLPAETNMFCEVTNLIENLLIEPDLCFSNCVQITATNVDNK
ncbi:MAG: N-acetylmuramoyl-L-alanine amidase [Kiritimatiellae bacterium]|jgi:N-acetylmuramoyl-L-alanine amidase|nr:N-acetylmuramoyl-L-alanine amidase [Kiritimatiellia bacterium]